MLNSKLDRTAAGGQQPADDARFDELVAAKLKRIKPAYPRATWDKLVAQLDRQDRIMRFVQRTKTIELAVACFLLLLLGQSPTGIPTAVPPHQRTIPTTPAPRAQAALDSPPNPFAKPVTEETAGIQPTILADQGILHLQSPALPDNSEPSADAVVASAELLPVNATLVDALPATNLASPSSQALAPSLRAEMYKPMPINAYEFAPAEPIAGIEAIGIGKYNYPDITPGDLPNIKPLDKKRFIRVGMLGSSDINRIITPPTTITQETEKVSFDRYAPGYGGGITLGFETQRWEVETGLIYAAKRYTPLQILYVEGSVKSGFFGASLENFELNTINVPLHFRYNYFVRDKWRLYALTGASWHVVTQANYYINFRPDALLLQAPAPHDSNPGRSTGLEEKNLVRGWLEGGSFMQNSYFSVNGGLGIERYMSTRWSIFAQPTYQHSLLYFGSGLGPYKDRMHTLSVLIGLKVRLCDFATLRL
ncbi:MAG: outer membrane beta-barrel protein [Saprospiraceae bacterium]|nr:outer membrane beta-barrel protein [Saprospiraceae bacterium]